MLRPAGHWLHVPIVVISPPPDEKHESDREKNVRLCNSWQTRTSDSSCASIEETLEFRVRVMLAFREYLRSRDAEPECDQKLIGSSRSTEKTTSAPETHRGACPAHEERSSRPTSPSESSSSSECSSGRSSGCFTSESVVAAAAAECCAASTSSSTSTSTESQQQAHEYACSSSSSRSSRRSRRRRKQRVDGSASHEFERPSENEKAKVSCGGGHQK